MQTLPVLQLVLCFTVGQLIMLKRQHGIGLRSLLGQQDAVGGAQILPHTASHAAHSTRFQQLQMLLLKASKNPYTPQSSIP